MNKMIVVTIVALMSVLGSADTHAKKAADTVSSNTVPAKVSSARVEAGPKAPRFVEARAEDIGPAKRDLDLELLMTIDGFDYHYDDRMRWYTLKVEVGNGRSQQVAIHADRLELGTLQMRQFSSLVFAGPLTPKRKIELLKDHCSFAYIMAQKDFVALAVTLPDDMTAEELKNIVSALAAEADAYEKRWSGQKDEF